MPVDIDLVVAFHHRMKAVEERLVGGDAELPAQDVPAALNLEEGLIRILRQLKTVSAVRRVEVTG